MKKIKSKIKKNNFNKKHIALFVVLLSVILVTPRFVFADGGIIANIGMKIVNSALYVVFQVSVAVLAIGKWFLDTMTNPALYSDVFLDPHSIKAINTAWGIVRDFFNMIFILIILMIAIGIILRVPKFSDKKNLLYVILAALLINFSKPIALAIIDVSQLGMNFFISGINDQSSSFTDGLLQSIQLKSIWSSGINKNTGVALTMIMSIILLLILGFMLFVLGITLLVRMVAFYVLIILSPFAMFGLALKGTGAGKMSNDWFEKIISWAFYGPVLTFFLYIALVLVNAIAEITLGDTGSAGYFNQYFNTNALIVGDNSLLGKILGMLIPYTAAIYLLYYGYDLSTQMSKGAAEGIMKWGKKKMNNWRGKVKSIAKSPWMSYVQPRIEGYRDRIGDKKGFGILKTKKTREKERKSKIDLRRAKAKGPDEYNKLMRGRVNEQLKEWDEKGAPETEDLRSFLESKNEKKRKAAAIQLAKDDNLNTADEYRDAVNSLGNDKFLVKKLEREATVDGRNMHAFAEYSIEEAQKVLASGDDNVIAKAIKTNSVLKRAINRETKRLQDSGIITKPEEFTDDQKIDYLLGRKDYKVGGSRVVEAADQHAYGKIGKSPKLLSGVGGFAGRDGVLDLDQLRVNAYQDLLREKSDGIIVKQNSDFITSKVDSGGEKVSDILKYLQEGSGNKNRMKINLSKAVAKESPSKMKLFRDEGLIS